MFQVFCWRFFLDDRFGVSNELWEFSSARKRATRNNNTQVSHSAGWPGHFFTSFQPKAFFFVLGIYTQVFSQKTGEYVNQCVCVCGGYKPRSSLPVPNAPPFRLGESGLWPGETSQHGSQARRLNREPMGVFRFCQVGGVWSLYFHPDPWGNDPIWLVYFSDGLKPPPRYRNHGEMYT